MSEQNFVIGLSARQDAAATALARVHADRPRGFTPAELIARIEQAFGGGETHPGGPRHFSPANRDENPTEGWDPLDAEQEPSAYVDPIEAAHEAGFEQGVAAATQAAQADTVRDRKFLTDLAVALEHNGSIDREQLARQLRQTVTVLVEKLVGEIGVSAELLALRVLAATDLLADTNESALLRVHPDDVALLEGHLPANVFAVGDAQMARGSFVMEAASTIVEDGPGMWLDQLSTAIDRVALPSC
jgi:flagellar assembly protein FliH